MSSKIPNYRGKNHSLSYSSSNNKSMHFQRRGMSQDRSSGSSMKNSGTSKNYETGKAAVVCIRSSSACK